MDPTYDCEWMCYFLWSFPCRGRYYYKKIVSHEPMHRFAPNFIHFLTILLWLYGLKLVDHCQRGRSRGRYKVEYFFSLTSSGLTFPKFHILLQHRRVCTCYDFHKWAWLNACVAPPRKFRKLSPALQIVREQWNSVHLYIMPRCTKKSLGAMT